MLHSALGPLEAEDELLLPPSNSNGLVSRRSSSGKHRSNARLGECLSQTIQILMLHSASTESFYSWYEWLDPSIKKVEWSKVRQASSPVRVLPFRPGASSHLALFLPFPLLHHDDLFRPRMRSFSTLLSSCRRSGARSRPSSAALRLSVSSATKSSSMRPRPRRRKNSVSPDLVDPSLVPTPTMCASLGRERSTRTPRRSPRGQIQSTWTKTVSRGATATNITS